MTEQGVRRKGKQLKGPTFRVFDNGIFITTLDAGQPTDEPFMVDFPDREGPRMKRDIGFSPLPVARRSDVAVCSRSVARLGATFGQLLRAVLHRTKHDPVRICAHFQASA